mmetsp:Transcript_53658/g.123394  ORF Transcript_53658/g.123394 Transcript_53658/m.123394 type:complete len:263 (+) Transcript_53658:313-1101(+)
MGFDEQQQPRGNIAASVLIFDDPLSLPASLLVRGRRLQCSVVVGMAARGEPLAAAPPPRAARNRRRCSVQRLVVIAYNPPPLKSQILAATASPLRSRAFLLSLPSPPLELFFGKLEGVGRLTVLDPFAVAAHVGVSVVFAAIHALPPTHLCFPLFALVFAVLVLALLLVASVLQLHRHVRRLRRCALLLPRRLPRRCALLFVRILFVDHECREGFLLVLEAAEAERVPRANRRLLRARLVRDARRPRHHLPLAPPAAAASEA